MRRYGVWLKTRTHLTCIKYLRTQHEDEVFNTIIYVTSYSLFKVASVTINAIDSFSSEVLGLKNCFSFVKAPNRNIYWHLLL